ncbi:MAG: winged helix DNA-binding domain-containing protein [Fimbriimonadaceae bacterium]|nr:winged helix DNA-binding domain-containing protein [Fimbriimonadaceae bacterium]
MSTPIQLSKSDVRRAMVRYHFSKCNDIREAFRRLRSIQFDPIAPVGCNHDLVLQSRVRDYRIGDWHELAYQDRFIYDGWDKQASLVPFEGWPLRRHIYTVHRRWFEKKIFEEHRDAVEMVLNEITNRGPLMPRDFEFQQRRDEWKGSWFGPSVTKQTLRALWHSGIIMTSGRKNGQHIYDLTERVVPKSLFDQPSLSEKDAQRELVLERHRAMGIVRPAAPPEVWSMEILAHIKKDAIAELVDLREIIPVDVEGVKAHVTPEFLALLDQPSLEPRVTFVAPLDQFMWDRKMIAHVFGFDYIWEIYVPEAKRRWGYYVLPVLYGDELVARVEFYCRDGVLELRRWHSEPTELGVGFMPALEDALRRFMHYSSAKRIRADKGSDAKVRALIKSIKP